MWKTDARIFVLLVLLLLVRGASAATCADIWPAATTGNSLVAPTLPTFTGTNALTLNTTLAASDFHYGTTSLSGGTLTTSAVTTRLYFNGDLSLTGTTRLNPTGQPENLIIIVNGSLSMSGQALVRGLIYATGSASLSGQSSVLGSVSAAGGISVSGTAGVTYDEDAVINASYGTRCAPPVPPTLKIVRPI